MTGGWLTDIQLSLIRDKKTLGSVNFNGIPVLVLILGENMLYLKIIIQHQNGVQRRHIDGILCHKHGFQFVQILHALQIDSMINFLHLIGDRRLPVRASGAETVVCGPFRRNG